MIENLLASLKNRIESDNSIFQSVNSGMDFEKYVIRNLDELKINRNDFGFKHNGPHSFPDLTIKFPDGSLFGLEIKFSGSGNWYSKGNSVFETHSNKENDEELAYKEIYILFGRKPKPQENKTNCEIRYSTYSNSIKKIEVTHSPRFAINMSNEKQDIFTVINPKDTYLKFRMKSPSEKNEFIKKYFSKLTKNNNQDKWYITNEDETQIKPMNFSRLNRTEKSRILSESFILFPYDLFQKEADYSEVGANMITRHFVYSTSLRDSFSAGGKIQIFENSDIRYPKILNTFREKQEDIKRLLKNPQDNLEDVCFKTWESRLKESTLIKIDKSLSLLENYSNIIFNLKPEMKIGRINTKEESIKKIDLSLFWSIS
ncbi:hypothetical protein [Bacillus atrophaeus]|uniref:hypothetical protein n=1 Tax=Bacillus atrophaeus TaxID=1452 RepID=UPI00227FA9B8|nr:hypothetical protein [Bacillus atrophaeus]MCY8516672.1 hypothetical protein [Bacillus atrophaeus]